MLGPVQNLGPIGSAVLRFIEYKHTDKQAKYRYRKILQLNNNSAQTFDNHIRFSNKS